MTQNKWFTLMGVSGKICIVSFIFIGHIFATRHTKPYAKSFLVNCRARSSLRVINAPNNIGKGTPDISIVC